jgi:hypothetical protein
LLQKCITIDKRFREKNFPANSESLVGFGPKTTKDDGEIEELTAKEWRITSEYYNSRDEAEAGPYPFCTGGMKSQEIQQGGVGTFYFLSGLSSVCSKPELLERIFVKREISKYAIY